MNPARKVALANFLMVATVVLFCVSSFLVFVEMFAFGKSGAGPPLSLLVMCALGMGLVVTTHFVHQISATT